MKILLCSIEQKTQKNFAQLRKILSKKAKLSKKNNGVADSNVTTRQQILLKTMN